MSKIKAKLLPLGMLLLFIAGTFMPRAASMLQDHTLSAQTDSRALNGIQLTLKGNGEITSVLSLLSSGHTKIELRDGAKLSDTDAIAAAREFISLLQKEKLLPEFTLSEEAIAMPFAAISDKDGNDSAVIWECEFMQQSPYACMVRIDDATKEPVSINVFQTDYTAASSADPSEKNSVKGAWDQAAYAERTLDESLEEARLWARFLQGYYGLDTAEVFDLSAKNYNGNYLLTFSRVTDELEITCQPMLVLQQGNISFNW